MFKMDHLADAFVVSQLIDTNIFKEQRLTWMAVPKGGKCILSVLNAIFEASQLAKELVVLQLAETEVEQISLLIWMIVVGKSNSWL
jgi:hypothetical protein